MCNKLKWRTVFRVGLLALVVIPLLAWVRSEGARAAPPAGEFGWLPRREVAVRTAAPAQKIPRVLHQVWKTHNIPAELQGYVKSWQVHNPEWEIRLWNDTESMALIQQHYPWFFKHIHHFKSGVEKADIFRYFILYHHGGVYMDLDMECLRPWEPLLARHDETFQCVLGAEPHAHAQKQQQRNVLVCNAAMISAARHPFWEEVFNALLDKVPEIANGDGWLSPVDSTGPGMLSLLYDVRPRAFSEVAIYPSSAFYPLRDSHDKTKAVDDPQAPKWRDSWAVHRWVHLWMHKKDKKNPRVRIDGNGGEVRHEADGKDATFLGDLNGGGGFQPSILQTGLAVPQPVIMIHDSKRTPLLFATIRVKTFLPHRSSGSGNIQSSGSGVDIALTGAFPYNP